MKRLALSVVLLAGCGTDGPGGGPPTLGTTPGQWDYVAIAGAKCMNGTDTGIGVNLGTSGDLVIYLEGGGACFNSSTCGSVAHPSGWNASNYANEIALYNVGLFDRIDEKNPFKDATYAFVPYCTGDVHAGSKPDGMGGRSFVGYVNIGKDLETIVPASKDVRRVVLSGSSAGGFGALINYERTQAAFGDTP